MPSAQWNLLTPLANQLDREDAVRSPGRLLGVDVEDPELHELGAGQDLVASLPARDRAVRNRSVSGKP